MPQTIREVPTEPVPLSVYTGVTKIPEPTMRLRIKQTIVILPSFSRPLGASSTRWCFRSGTAMTSLYCSSLRISAISS